MKLDLGVHHVGLNVKDLEACRQFYVETLGLTPLPRPDFGFPGVWLQAGNQQIHLLQQSEFQEPAAGQHFAFEVADLDAAVEELRAAGVQISDAFEIPDVGRQAFLRDPDGNGIELNQPRR